VQPNHVWYVDSVNGSPTGDGSAAHPWNSLQAVFQVVTGVGGPYLSTVPYNHRDPVTGRYAIKPNPLLPVKPGDAIELMSGSYGDILIKNVVNSDFVTIEAAPGQGVTLGALNLQNSNKFVFSGLTFQKQATGKYLQIGYVAGNTDIVFSHDTFQSQADVSAWAQSDWLASGANVALLIAYNATALQSCISITDNNVQNVRLGLNVSANRALIVGNKLNNLGGDYIDFVGNNVTVTGNTGTNARSLGDGNHNDFVQMLTAAFPSGTLFTNVHVDGNIFVAQTDPNLPFPADGSGYPSPTAGTGIQCLGLSSLNGFTVQNNICVISAWNGVWGGSLQNGTVEGNTILGSWPRGAGIGRIPRLTNVTVRNNIVNWPIAAQAGMTADHNLTLLNLAAVQGAFMTFNPTLAQYDLRLSAGSPAIGAGVLDPALPTDILGAARFSPPDLGALNRYVPPPAAVYKPTWQLFSGT
jgi:hypothetical protein